MFYVHSILPRAQTPDAGQGNRAIRARPSPAGGTPFEAAASVLPPGRAGPGRVRVTPSARTRVVLGAGPAGAEPHGPGGLEQEALIQKSARDGWARTLPERPRADCFQWRRGLEGIPCGPVSTILRLPGRTPEGVHFVAVSATRTEVTLGPLPNQCGRRGLGTLGEPRTRDRLASPRSRGALPGRQSRKKKKNNFIHFI